MDTSVRDRSLVDPRAVASLDHASPEVSSSWVGLSMMAFGELPPMGLAAGERPAADVEVLCSAVAIAECELARRMHAASVSGSLPLTGAGALPLARGWSAGWAKRLASAGEFAARWPQIGSVWAAGVITSEHVQAVARHADSLTGAQLGAVLDELVPLWGRLTPRAVGMFVERVIRMLHPPPDPEPDERDAYESRSLGFALTGDSVLLSGVLPRLEGEALIAAIDAFADRLRSEADHVPASSRRADALKALVNAAHASGGLPSRGGLPVSVSVTMDTTSAGDVVWSSSRGHTLTRAEARFACCDALVTPIVLDTYRAVPDSGDDELPGGVTGVTGVMRVMGGRLSVHGDPGAGAIDPGEGHSRGVHLVRADSQHDDPGGPHPGATHPGGAHPGGAHPGGVMSFDPESGGDNAGGPGSGALESVGRSPTARISALAVTLLGTRMPLAVGRTARTATSAQRRALAARDRGCIVPGCGIAAENCQTHHVHEWADGGESDLSNLECCAGPITGRSTSGCGPSHQRHPVLRRRLPRILVARLGRPGRPTTALPGLSPEPHVAAGDCEDLNGNQVGEGARFRDWHAGQQVSRSAGLQDLDLDDFLLTLVGQREGDDPGLTCPGPGDLPVRRGLDGEGATRLVD